MWLRRALIWWYVSRHEEGEYPLQNSKNVADLGYLCVCLFVQFHSCKPWGRFLIDEFLFPEQFLLPCNSSFGSLRSDHLQREPVPGLHGSLWWVYFQSRDEHSSTTTLVYNFKQSYGIQHPSAVGHSPLQPLAMQNGGWEQQLMSFCHGMFSFKWNKTRLCLTPLLKILYNNLLKILDGLESLFPPITKKRKQSSIDVMATERFLIPGTPLLSTLNLWMGVSTKTF